MRTRFDPEAYDRLKAAEPDIRAAGALERASIAAYAVTEAHSRNALPDIIDRLRRRRDVAMQQAKDIIGG